MHRYTITRHHAVVFAFVIVVVLIAALLGVMTAVGAGDDNIPGVPISDKTAPQGTPEAGAFTDSLNDHIDFDDVFAVPLAVNDKIEVSLTGANGTQFDMWLWGPNAKNILVDQPLSRVVQSAQTAGTSTEHFWYPVRNAGVHYLHVFNPLNTASSSVGTYTVDYKVTKLTAPTLTFKAPATVGWGKKATLSGTVAFDGVPMTGARVLIQSKVAGSSSWKDLNFDSKAYRPKLVAGADGKFSYQVIPSKKTQYRAMVWPTENTGWKFGSAVTVTPKVRLGYPHTPKSVKRNKKFTAYGVMQPRHTARAKTVTISFYKGKKAVHVRAVNVNYNSATWKKATKYSAKVKLPSKGRWKVVARTKASGSYAATTSSTRYITVK